MRAAVATLFAVCCLVAALPNAGATHSAPRPHLVRVRNVQLDGADSIPESITNVIRERISGARFRKDKLSTSSFGRLRQVLFGYGYMEAVVEKPIVTQVDKDLVDLAFHVEPGTRYYYSGLAINGVTAFPPQQVRDLIPIHPNDPVDYDKLKAGLDGIRQLYACSGFLDANPVVEENYHRATHTLFFTVTMKEGEVSTISGVKVVGLESALVDKVITLPELQPKSVFSSCNIREAIRAFWPAKDSSSESSFLVRDETEAPHRVRVVIDFSPNRTISDKVEVSAQE